MVVRTRVVAVASLDLVVWVEAHVFGGFFFEEAEAVREEDRIASRGSASHSSSELA